MYYLEDGPERAFVSEELMLIPEETVILIVPIYIIKFFIFLNKISFLVLCIYKNPV